YGVLPDSSHRQNHFGRRHRCDPIVVRQVPDEGRVSSRRTFGVGMNIAVIGTGYVGLVAGSCFAESGNDVSCVDNDAGKIEKLQKGVIPIYEPGLPEIVERNLREERLTFTTDLDAAVKKSLLVFIGVGKPT